MSVNGVGVSLIRFAVASMSENPALLSVGRLVKDIGSE